MTPSLAKEYDQISAFLMQTTLNVLRVIVAAVAALIIGSSKYPSVTEDAYPAVYAVFTFLSVLFLHWLLLRYLVVDGLQPSSNAKQLQAAGDRGYTRSFFRGTTGIGYLFVFSYVSQMFHGSELFRNGKMLMVPDGFLFLGITFLFLGLIARARGIIVSLLAERVVPAPAT